jgi:hypothetical protein
MQITEIVECLLLFNSDLFSFCLNYTTYNMLPVLYGCETLYLTLREKTILRRVLRRLLGPKREEVTEGWRKMHKELHYFYSAPNMIREDEMDREIAW